jgi:O-antigen/teichoic acid export membrane protein
VAVLNIPPDPAMTAGVASSAGPGSTTAQNRPAAVRGIRGALMRDSGIYLLGNLMQKAAGFVLIPLYTHALSTAQYGLLELANSVVNLLLVVAALGVPASINKVYHRDCSDEAARRRLLGTAILFTVVTTAGIALVGHLFETQWAGLIYHGPEGLLVYRYTLVWLVLAQWAVVPFEFLRTAGRSHLFVGLSLTQLLIQSGCIVFLVLGRGLGLRGVLIGNVAGLVAVNLAGAFVLARRVAWRADRRLLRAMVAYGLAMIPVFVSGWVVNLSDRFFVQSMVGLGALGVYALGYKFGALVDLLIVMPVQRAWTPIFFRIAGEPDAPRRLALMTTYLMAALCFCSLAISLAVPPFLRLGASAEFRGASGIVPLVCLAYLLGGLANCLGNGLVVAERLRLIAGYALIAALANLALNAILIPWIGIWGAAVATALAFAVQLLGTLRSLGRHYPVPVEWGRMGGLAIAALAPLGASYLLPDLPLIPDVAARTLLLCGFPLIVAITRLARPDEIKAAAHGVAWLRRSLTGS